MRPNLGFLREIVLDPSPGAEVRRDSSPGRSSSVRWRAGVRSWPRLTSRSEASGVRQSPGSSWTAPWTPSPCSAWSSSQRLRSGVWGRRCRGSWWGRPPTCCRVPSRLWCEPSSNLNGIGKIEICELNKKIVNSLNAGAKVNKNKRWGTYLGVLGTFPVTKLIGTNSP